ncbi:MAG: ATP-binding protein [Firmicutes bacterium]|nr:ATP-binding protein [Bacillota bacterium]
MKIHSLSITNFRGYRDTVTIPFDNLTVFVGKNDVGKSTILEALYIFFHDGKGLIKIDKSDVNIQENRGENHDIAISVVFDELPDQVIIDATSITTLQAEHLLNEEGRLEIIKKFHNGATPKVFIKAQHPTNPNCADLLLKKNDFLKEIVQSNNIECDNQASNVKLREAIWNHFADELQLQSCEIDASKEDAKKIWEKLSSYMPVYSLFQSDRKNSDGDSEIQDPLQEAVKEIIKDPELQATLSTVAEEVTRKLQEVSTRTLEKLQEMDPSIANSLNPEIPSVETLKWADVFKKVSIAGDEDIPINKRGSGVKRLVLLNFFRAEAERRFQNGDNTGVIYAIEEPETSQHTANQRVLIQALKTLSGSPHTQIILTTHSGIIVKELDFSNLRLVTDVDGQKQVLEVDPGVLHYPSLNEVIFSAFGEVAEEYHNELYGFLDLQDWLADYKQGKQQLPYNRENQNGEIYIQQLTRTEIIRHQIHHPENTHNTRFTHEELQHSIEEMRQYIRERAEEVGLWDPIEEY